MKLIALAIGLAACSRSDSNPRRPDPPREASVPADVPADAAAPPAPARPDAKVTATPIDGGTVTGPMTCEDAKRAIVARRFVGWTGLPATCKPDAMFGVPYDEPEWPARTLGKKSTRWAAVDIAGYYEPTISVRHGVIVLFDGMNPELDGGWAPLAADLGQPEAKLDWYRDTILMKAGEWVYPARGITIFGRAAGDAALHIAVYAPTTLKEYEASLRPDLGGTMLP
jgi:hypothetical protein